MSEELIPYYNRELIYIRQFAQDFAKKYPAAASRLLLETASGRSTDPHVERLIESFAFLAARVHHKIADEFPELTDAMLGVLYPHYLAPIPSAAIIQFQLDAARAQLPNGFLIDRGSKLHTQSVGEVQCRFRTSYPVRLWPVEVTSARLMPPPFPAGYKPPPRTVAALRLALECQADMKFEELSLDRLRFYLSGDSQPTAALYEFLFNNAIQVVFRPLDPGAKQAPIVMEPQDSLFPVGFGRDEGMLAYPNQSFLGYRLLTEFFAFPQKFLFVDIAGFQQVKKAGFQRRLEVVVFLNRSLPAVEQSVDANTFRLGATPVINLFDQVAEPIQLKQTRFEYQVVPDVAHALGLEVYSIDAVTSVDPVTSRSTEYQPFYSFRHGGNRDSQDVFWHMSRRLALRENDRGTDVFLHLVDMQFDPRLPAESVLVVRTTCTNRDVAAQLQRAGDEVYFELEAAAPLKRIRCLRSPTSTLRPPMKRGAYWRLISHLNLSHLSISDPKEGRATLQEILKLYDFSDPEAGQQMAAVNQQLIDGILSIQSRRVVGRTGGPTASGFAQGVEVLVEFDEQKYVGTGVYLFACVLERFLGLYANINSFTQLVARTKQGEGYLKKWPPRAAEQQLV